MKSYSILAVPSLTLALLAVPALSQQAGAQEPCVLEGKTQGVTFPRPDLLAPGFPLNSNWVGGTGEPCAYEDDSFFGDDPVGPATPCWGFNVNCATVPITNDNGNLIGPNGEVLNGGFGEGECIELYTCWTFTFPIKVTRCFSVGFQFKLSPGEGVPIGPSGGVGKEVCVQFDIQVVGTTCSSPKDLCPC